MIRRLSLCCSGNILKIPGYFMTAAGYRSATVLCSTSSQCAISNASSCFNRSDTKFVRQTTVFERFFSTENEVEVPATVDYNYVKEAVSNKNSFIIDVREPAELKEHGQIPNSINIPLDLVSSTLSSMPDEDFQKVYKKTKPTEETEIIFYCMVGRRSGIAQQKAIDLGYKKVKNYLGSWTDWASKS